MFATYQLVQDFAAIHSWNGGTVTYEAILCGYIHLHRPYIGFIYIYDIC